MVCAILFLNDLQIHEDMLLFWKQEDKNRLYVFFSDLRSDLCSGLQVTMETGWEECADSKHKATPGQRSAESCLFTESSSVCSCSSSVVVNNAGSKVTAPNVNWDDTLFDRCYWWGSHPPQVHLSSWSCQVTSCSLSLCLCRPKSIHSYSFYPLFNSWLYSLFWLSS